MLTDQEKEHIYEEELYRREVKIRLEVTNPKDSKWQKFWSIVNSGIFIWFLSSIILGSVSFLYNQWQKENEQARDKAEQEYIIERENQRTANRLDAEITGRLVYYNNLLIMRNAAHNEWEKIGSSQSFYDYDVEKLVIALERPSTTDYPTNVFPEYLNRNLRSLLWELLQVTPEQERKTILPAYEKSLQLSMIYLRAHFGTKLPTTGLGIISAPQVRELRKSYIAEREFYTTFNLQRWGCPFTEMLQKESVEKSRDSVSVK